MQLNTGRRDYDHSIRMSATLPGEPVFILKGHDPHAADTVRDYAQRAHEGGAHPALVESALQLADEMEAFPTKRAPDVGHLDDHEQKQLAYQLQRRAWAATASRARPWRTSSGSAAPATTTMATGRRRCWSGTIPPGARALPGRTDRAGEAKASPALEHDRFGRNRFAVPTEA